MYIPYKFLMYSNKFPVCVCLFLSKVTFDLNKFPRGWAYSFKDVFPEFKHFLENDKTLMKQIHNYMKKGYMTLALFRQKNIVGGCRLVVIWFYNRKCPVQILKGT